MAEDLDAKIGGLEQRLHDLTIVQPEHVDVDSTDNVDLSIGQDLVDALWMLKAGFQEVDSLEELGNTEAALESLSKVDAKVRDFEANFGSALLVIDMERETAVRRARLLATIEDTWANGVNVIDGSKSDEGAHIKIEISEPDVKLVSIYLPALLDDFLAEVGRHFIDPLIELGISTVDSTSSGSVKVIQGCPETVASLTGLVTTFTEALMATALGPRIARRYGHYLVDGIARKALPSLFPSNPNELTAFKQDLQSVLALENRLHELGWTYGRELTNLVDNIDMEWSQSRHAVYLGQMRDLLSGELTLQTLNLDTQPEQPSESEVQLKDEWDWNSDDEDEAEQDTEAPEKTELTSLPEDKPDKFEELLSLVQAHQRELPGLEAELGMLFRALAPLHYGLHQLLLYNHSQQLARVLGHSAESQQLSNFAQKQLGAALHRYSKEIEEELTPLDLESIEPSVKASELLKNRVGTIAAEVSQQSGFSVTMRETVLSSVVEQIASSVVMDIERLTSIGERHSERLSDVLGRLQALSAYFEDVVQSVPSWIKMLRLRQLLTANLATIRHMLASAELVDFTADELASLLRALFEDSDKRRELILDVYNT